MDAQQLYAKKKAAQTGLNPQLAIRVHRGISWLKKAEIELRAEDLDSAFVFYWISFNAVFSRETQDRDSNYTSDQLREFFAKLLALDSERQIHDTLWTQYSQIARVLMQNKYIYRPFWNYHNGIPGYDNWQQRFEKDNAFAFRALTKQDTLRCLCIIFSRLYVLRNQIIHGGATYQSQVNRDQVRDGSTCIAALQPLFIDIMLSAPTETWQNVNYQVIES